MVRFRVDVTLQTGIAIKRVGEILEVGDEHVDLWADYEAAGYIVRLPAEDVDDVEEAPKAAEEDPAEIDADDDDADDES